MVITFLIGWADLDQCKRPAQLLSLDKIFRSDIDPLVMEYNNYYLFRNPSAYLVLDLDGKLYRNIEIIISHSKNVYNEMKKKINGN